MSDQWTGGKGDARRRYTLEVGNNLDVDHLSNLHAHAVGIRSHLT